MSALKSTRGMWHDQAESGEGGEGGSKANVVTNTSTSTFTRPHSVETMIARYFRLWQACRRRRKRRKTNTRKQYKAKNNKIRQTCGNTRTHTRFNVAATWPNDIFTKEKLRNMLISCQATSGVRGHSRNMQNEIEKATTITNVLLADYGASDMKQARNSICLQATTTTTTTKAKMKRVSVATKTMLCMCDGATTTTTAAKETTSAPSTEATKMKITKCARLLSECGKQQQQVQKHARAPKIARLTTNTHRYLPCIIQQQQQQQQHEAKQVSAAALQNRFEPDLQRICCCECAAFPYQKPEHKMSIQQQRYTQWLAPAVTAEQKRNSQQIAKHRSWRNLISHVVIAKTPTTTTTITGTTIDAITTKTPPNPTTIICAADKTRITTTKKAEIAIVATTTTKLDSCSTLAIATNAKTRNSVTANASDMRPMTIATTTGSVDKKATTTTTCTTLQQQQSQHVAESVPAHKTKCRKVFSLTSALVEAKKLHQTNAATTITTRNTRITLARGKTPMTLLGDILTLLVGTLTLHTIVLHCLLIASLALVTSATAKPVVGRNSFILLTQQASQKHLHNNNNNNSADSSSSSINRTATTTTTTSILISTHNYNAKHDQLPIDTTATRPPMRMMDVEVLNGSSGRINSSSIFDDNNNTNIFKSLSSIVEANFAQEDMSQMPIFDFGLPRNITARTSQAEATIKCRVERLDDKSVSWIRKRDLHILTVATATYTSDKRFQVTSSKDGREWMLHVKSPHVRDSGIYECQVNTEPKVSMAFQLNIIEIPADSRAIITGPADLHFKVGSAIILNCHVQQPSKRDIGPIYWYRGEHIITPFEVADDDIIYSSNTASRMGSSIATPQMWPPTLVDNEMETDLTATIANLNAFTGASRAKSVHSLTTTTTTAQHDGLTNEITPDFTSRIAMESQLGDTMKSSSNVDRFLVHFNTSGDPHTHLHSCCIFFLSFLCG